MNLTLKVQVPEQACAALRKSPSELAQELLRSAVCKWYELGWVSQAKGAELLELSRSDFIDLLARYGVSPFQESAEDLREQAARR